MKLICCMTVCFSLSMLAPGRLLTADSHGASSKPAVIQASVAQRFARVEQELAALENTVDQIDRTKQISGGFDFDAALATYYDDLQEVYNGTMQATMEEARSVQAAIEAGRRINTSTAAESLRTWEQQVGLHRSRMEKIISRLTEISMRVRDGRIMLSQEFITKLSREDRQELRKWLTAEAIQKYDAIDTRLFGANWVEEESDRHRVPEERFSGPDDAPGRRWDADVSRRARRVGFTLSPLKSATPEPAPALAAGCVAICAANADACIPCIAGAIGAGAALVTQLNNALRGCDRNRIPFLRFLCKAGTILAFLALIA